MKYTFKVLEVHHNKRCSETGKGKNRWIQKILKCAGNKGGDSAMQNTDRLIGARHRKRGWGGGEKEVKSGKPQ